MAPIKGVTERPRLPRLGKIRLGIKVQGQGKREHPKATNHFVCPPEVIEVFGAEPTSLSIRFPTEDVEQWAAHWYRSYSSYRGLTCKGDGERANRLVDLDRVKVTAEGELPQSDHPTHWPVARHDASNTTYRGIDCAPDSCPQFAERLCRPVMNLMFMLPEVEGLGIYQIDTSSWNSIRNVLSGIMLIRALIGRVGGIPLTLSLVPQQVQVRVDDKQVVKTVRVLRLTAPYRLRDLYRYAELPPGQAFILPAGDLEPPDDLFPEEEPTIAPPEETVETFFEPPPEEAAFFCGPEDLAADGPTTEAEQRAAAWAGIKEIIASGSRAFTAERVAAWLQKHAKLVVSVDIFDRDQPPESIPTGVLGTLHDAMSQRQLSLGGDRPPEYAG